METADKPMILKASERAKRNLAEATETNRPPQLMTRTQFINHFQITPRCELYWRHQGRIPIIKIGKRVYYLVSDVIKFQESHIKNIISNI